MKKKRLAALAVAFALVLSLSVSAFALGGLSIGDFLQIVSSIDTSKYTEFNEQEWSTMTPAERAEQFNFVISDQKGTSNITSSSDFINDSDLSYRYYCDLIHPRSGVNPSFGNLWAKTYLENNGLADFGMGYHNSDGGHSGSKFGDGTVADTLNDDFLNYMRNVPYGSNTRYLFSNGYSISWEPVFLSNESTQMDINGVKHQAAFYRLRFLLYDASGVLCDTAYGGSIAGYGRFDDRVCLTCGIQPFSDLTITDDGYYFYSVSSGSFQHKFHDSPIPQKIKLPWYDKYGQPTVVTDDPLATGTDENGNQIQFNINSDGVTYEGSTYNYNDDNSVTINGNTYYITVNPKDVDEDYYKQFLQQVINNYYNYYNTDSTPFDDKDIISAVKSVFTSLETFRSYCYSQLKQIGDYILDGFNSMRSSLKKIISRLDDIIKYLKDISKNVEDLTKEQEEKNKSDWADLISDFKDKVGWASLDKSMHNIQTAFFGQREYSVHSDTGEIQVQILQKDAAPLASSMPNLSITYMGQSYNLYSCVAYFGGDIEPIKQFISLFLWVGFILSVFRSIPSILGGVGALQKDTHFLSKDGD